MGEFNEYVFCPYCGGITAPGTCVNCGMPTNGQSQSQNETQNVASESVMPKTEPAYAKYQPQGEQPQQASGQYQPQTQQAQQSGGQYQPQGQSVQQGNGQYQTQGQQMSQYQSQGQQMSSQQSQVRSQSGPQGYAQYQPKAMSETSGNVQEQTPAPSAQGYNPYQQPMGTNNYGYGAGQTNNQGMGQNFGQAQNGGNQYSQPNVTYNEKPKKKSRWWIWLLVIGFILFFGVIIVAIAIIAAMIFFGTSDVSTLGNNSPTQGTTPPQVTVPDSTEDEYDDSTLAVYARELGRLNFGDFDWDFYADSAMVYSDTTDGSKDFYLNKDYQSTFGSNHDNHTLSEFTGQYYEPFVDCIDTSYDYRLSRHYLTYSNVVDEVIVNADIAYIQFEGDTIPNEEELNRRILEMTANDFWGYLQGQTSLAYIPSEVNFMVDSFIPYNDGEKMSILLDVNTYLDGYREEHYIYAINIDLVNGEIMDNASILKIDEDFGAMFRERNNAQNGEDVIAVVNCTDKELADLLSDPDTNIVFFSPYGMEVGINYMADGYSWGWVSITLSDYEDYLQ